MVGRSRYWFLVLLVGVIAVTALPGRAEAQTTSCSITMSTQAPVIRVNDTSNRSSSSSDPTVKLTLTRGDCSDPELKYKFALAITGYTVGWQVQAWAGRNGSDCPAEFSGADNLKTCWKLGNLAVSNMSATAEYTPSQIMGVDPAQLYGNSKRILTSCDDTSNTDSGRQQFNVYFFITYSNVVQCKQTQQMYYSLTGPAGPTISRVNAADSALQVAWNSIAANLTTDVTYEFYCALNESDGGCKSSELEAVGARSAGDAAASAGAGGVSAGGGAGNTSAGAGAGGTSAAAGGTSSSSGADNAGGTSSAGTSSDLWAAGDAGMSSSAGATGDATASSSNGGASSTGGATSDTTADTAGAAGATSSKKLSALRCGSIRGKTNTSGFTDPSVMSLENDSSYAITIGVRDTYGNLGTLSPYVCQNARQIDTFFEKYRDPTVGGKAGGGFCNLDVRPKHGTVPAAFGALGLLSWLRRRRQQPRRRGESNSSTP